MLLILFLIRFGYAEKSVLLIGGDYYEGSGSGPATVEQFFPSNMSSRIIANIETHLDDDIAKHANMANSSTRNAKRWVQATPVNASHAILMWWGNSSSFYIDTAGKQTPGPGIDARFGPGLTSMPGKNGQMTPIYCGGLAESEGWNASKDCKVINSSHQHNFKHMLKKRTWPSLIAFDNTLIVIGHAYQGPNQTNATVERYNGTEWISCNAAPFDSYRSPALKLNETALLTCAGWYPQNAHRERKKCYVYHVDRNEWTPGPEMNASGLWAEMVLIDQTVYAFAGYEGMTNIQTLDISDGIWKAQWKLEDVKLNRNRSTFGIWVINSTPITTTGGHTFSILCLILFLSIAAYFVLGVLYRRFVMGERGIQQLPNHAFWLRIYRRCYRTRQWCATKLAWVRFRIRSRFGSSISTENQTYNRFEEYNDTRTEAWIQQQAVVE